MKTILIVDDESQIRDVYRRIIQATCKTIFRVVESSNAADAMERLMREKIDLVLLDIRMPQVSGQEIYEVIKACNPRIRVIVASVYPIEEQKRLIPFATDYYDKSYGPIRLLQKIAESFISENGEVEV